MAHFLIVFFLQLYPSGLLQIPMMYGIFLRVILKCDCITCFFKKKLHVTQISIPIISVARQHCFNSGFLLQGFIKGLFCNFQTNYI